MMKQDRFHPPTYSPSLVFPHGRKERSQTFFTLSDGRYHVRSIPEMRGMQSMASCHGWLIMWEDISFQSFLLNPISMEKVKLPPMEEGDYSFYAALLTSSPNDPNNNCLVIFLTNKKNCYFCRPHHDERWIKKELKLNSSLRIFNAITYKGKIYLDLEERDKIGILDITENCATVEIFEISIPPNTLPDLKPIFYYHVEYCGEIFRVIKTCFEMYDERQVETFDVFKLDFSRMVWVKVDSLGEAIFFLDYCSCVSVSAAEFKLKGDCIYFFQPGDRSLYRFNMYNKTITATLPCPNVVRRWSPPYWLVPNFCLLEKQGMMEVEQTKIEDEVKGEKRAWNDFQGEILESSISHLKEDIKGDESPWKDLPMDILELIISHLFLGDFIRFRLTCQAWKTISPPLIRSPPTPFHSMSQQSPWFMFFPNNDSGVCKFFHLMYNDTCLVNFPELEGAIIRHSKYGWLLMSRGFKTVFFFNPFTRVSIKLPDLTNDDESFSLINITFSSPPTSSNCVVFACEESGRFAKFAVCRRGEDTWTYRRFCGMQSFMVSRCNPIFYDGVFYCLAKDGKIGIFDPKEEEEDLELEEEEGPIWRILPKIRGPNFSIYRSFITECDGEFLSIFVGRSGSPICIFRLDRVEMKWVKVESLGNKMIFVSHTTSLLVPSTLKGTENKIYFPRFHGNNIVFYSLSTGKYHSFEGDYCKEDWYDTDEQWYCTWIEVNFDTTDEEVSWVENHPLDED